MGRAVAKVGLSGAEHRAAARLRRPRPGAERSQRDDPWRSPSHGPATAQCGQHAVGLIAALCTCGAEQVEAGQGRPRRARTGVTSRAHYWRNSSSAWRAVPGCRLAAVQAKQAALWRRSLRRCTTKGWCSRERCLGVRGAEQAMRGRLGVPRYLPKTNDFVSFFFILIPRTRYTSAGCKRVECALGVGRTGPTRGRSWPALGPRLCSGGSRKKARGGRARHGCGTGKRDQRSPEGVGAVPKGNVSWGMRQRRGGR